MSYSDDLPFPRQPRAHEWTVERQLEFLDALAQTGNVTAAAAAVGMSFASAYRLRGRDGADAFRFGWKAAQEMAYYRVRDLALDRIETGVDAAITYHGKSVGTRKVFSDRLLVALLDHLKPGGEVVDKFGARRPAADPGTDFARAVDAYAAALDSGADPVPPAAGDDFVGGTRTPEKKVMTREEFVARLDRIANASSEQWRAECAAAPGSDDATTMQYA